MKIYSKLWHVFKAKAAVSTAIILTLFILTGLFAYQTTKAQVKVTEGDKVITVQTHADTVGEVLEDLNITIGLHDELSHETEDLISSEMDINIVRAKSVMVSIDGEEQELFTTADTVGEFLTEAGIELEAHDRFTHQADDPIEDDLQLDIQRAFQVTVNDAGDEQVVWTTGGTVKELLQKEEIELDKLDRLTPKETESLDADTIVEIVRVEKVTDIVKETKNFSTVTKQDNTLEKGKKQVVAEGEEGIIEKRYEVTLENGEEVKRKLVKEVIEKESEQRVIAVGTKVKEPVVTLASTSNNPTNANTATVSRGKSETNASKTYYMHATAYTAECNGCSGITATGINLNANPNARVIAVDPNVIPLGTKVWVEGYGTAVAGDTGGAIKGNRIDLHVSSKGEALKYGSKQVQVKILD